MSDTSPSVPKDNSPEKKTARKNRRAIGPRLRPVLNVVWVLLAILAANSLYLTAVRIGEWTTGEELQTWFFQWMFLGHLVVGLLLVTPFVIFCIGHMRNTFNRKNRRAVRVGYALFTVSLIILISGLALTRMDGLEWMALNGSSRDIAYWAHVLAPVGAVWLYLIHRLVGPKIKWRRGFYAGGGVVTATLLLGLAHSWDPRVEQERPKEGLAYFEPSLAETKKGTFIPASTLMNDQYCIECHQDTHADWKLSAHHFSSFNNPAYLASIRETREVSMRRDGDVKASRWCAGCHDPVPLFSGAFDDPNFDDRNHPTSQAGITCTVCHAIQEVDSPKGNADYVIDEPVHYPMANSDSSVARWVSNQLIKANPSFHKRTFLKPLHKTSEFCGSCHKVHLPGAVTAYRPFLRGQNHYDSYHLSGVSGHGARSFYYPPSAQADCNGCHMPRYASNDFGASNSPDGSGLSIHSHLFPAANTGLAWLLGADDIVDRQRAYLEGVARVDIFGIRYGDGIDAELSAPLRPSAGQAPPDASPSEPWGAKDPSRQAAPPLLVRGQPHLIETIIRTLKVGHHFTQGTIDSNEIWLDIEAVDADGRVVGRSGAMDDAKHVDPASHFVNAFVIDKDGYRIDRRNAQDIFVKLYDHQIPPGAGQAVHYRLNVPEDAASPLTVRVKLQYRKFDQPYMQYIADALREKEPIRGEENRTGTGQYVNELPVTTIASDEVKFALVDSADELATASQDLYAGLNEPRDIPAWQRWNDYGIGLFLKGKAELKQAAAAFAEVEALGRPDGPMNLARTFFTEGRLDEATAALGRAADGDYPAPWTLAWLSGRVARQQGDLEAAERQFRTVLDWRTEESVARGFDFSLDYVVLNDLGQTLFDRAKRLRGESRKVEREAVERDAVATFERTLAIDPENVTAHYNLALLHRRLGDEEKGDYHRERHGIYKPDDNARDRAERLARQRYPEANKAAEKVVIYDLNVTPVEEVAVR